MGQQVCQVEGLILAGNGSGVYSPINRPEGDDICPLHNVLIGEDQPRLVDNETSAAARSGSNLYQAPLSILNHVGQR